MRDDIELSPDQEIAYESILSWRQCWPDSPQTFALGGLAGTGKSFLASLLHRKLGKPIFCAPTGKAASVLRDRGVHDANTIHGTIYNHHMVDGKSVWERRPKIDGEIFIVDEASMVEQKILTDLLAYEKQILFIGDHGQLEPVGDNPYLMKNPDARLEKIHRQAEGNPVLRLAMAFREGRQAQVWKAMNDAQGRWQDKSNRVTVTSKREFDDLYHAGTQVICGFNSTRHRLNKALRQRAGRDGPLPDSGDPLVCLSNLNDRGFFNGQPLYCLGVDGKPRGGIVDVWIGYGEGQMELVPILIEQLGKNTISTHRNRKVLLVDYAYAMTAHKCQGSSFEDVLVYEEIGSSWDARRWRYTAVTRASETVRYCV